ncbi:hypothetical protein BGZ95_002763 [Linnemannia exigua]|uniref:F-box domain-containing protein n=1 Tax=Linnemannia exigua TaxID=604196 RepID=A0AAD4DLV0_9FUNG|nr:hypothetical protein BGZ95_002763 [Linnemannia exigua]
MAATTTNNSNSTIFDLPELAQHIARHLPQDSLFQCVRVSKSWHEAFIRHLWKTFKDYQMFSLRSPTWGNGLVAAISSRHTDPQEYEWYMDVYRRHARYIRHLSIFQPAILDACLENAFGGQPSSSSPLSNDIRATGSSSSEGTTADSIATGRSLLTNLESLAICVTRQSLAAYIPEAFATTQESGTARGLFGSISDNSYPPNNNIFIFNSNDSNGAATEPTTTTPTTNDRPEKIFIDACQRLIHCNPRLQTLSCPFSPQILEGILPHPDSDGGNGSCSAPALRSLRSVTLGTFNGRIPMIPPHVTSLRLTCNRAPFSYPSKAPKDLFSVLAGLQELDVNCVESGSHLQQLLRQVPSIETLSFYSLPSSTLGGFGGGGEINNTNSLQTFLLPAPVDVSSYPLSRITVLKCHQRSGAFSIAPAYNDIFRCFPLLVEYHDDAWHPCVTTQLVKYCPLLELIRVRIDPAINDLHASDLPTSCRMVRRTSLFANDRHNSISTLLSSLSRLRILELPFESIKASEILERPWICLDLEELWCRLENVPFLSDEQQRQVLAISEREKKAEAVIGDSIQQQSRTNEEERLMEINERCVSTRRLIMTQLSKMTSLKSLSLSPDLKIRNELFEQRTGATFVYKSKHDGRNYIRYDDISPDTLHFRLDSGFEQLASLKQLEYLGFESMDHRMDTAEIEWMAQQFPKLKEMRGLSTENYVGMEPDPKNDALVALMRRLRPDVIQGQSFGGYATSRINLIGTTTPHGGLF